MSKATSGLKRKYTQLLSPFLVFQCPITYDQFCVAAFTQPLKWKNVIIAGGELEVPNKVWSEVCEYFFCKVTCAFGKMWKGCFKWSSVESATDRHRGFFQLSERGAVPATLPLSYLLFLYVVVKCLILDRCLRTNCAFKPFRPIVNIAKV